MSSILVQSLRQGEMTQFQIVAVGICLVINMLDGFDVLAIAFAAPSIAQEWQLLPSELGILFSSGLAGMMAGSLLIAPLADIFGRRLIILACLVLISVGMLLSATVDHLIPLALLRLLTGAGIGSMLASINTIAAEYSSERRQNLSISLMHVGYPAGAMAGGIVSAALIGQYGWQSVMIFGGAMTAAMIPIVWWRLPESIDYLIVRQPPKALDKVNLVLKRLGRPTLGELPAITEATPARASLLEIFKGPLFVNASLVCAAFFSMLFVFYFVASWTPKILVDLGLSVELGISGAVLMNMGGATGALCLGLLSNLIPLRRVVSGFMLLASLLIVTFGYLPEDEKLLMIVVFLIGIFMFGSMIGLYVIVPRLFPANLRNTGTGLAIGIGRLGATAGPYVAGMMITAGWERSSYYLAFAIPVLIALIAIRSIPDLKRPDVA